MCDTFVATGDFTATGNVIFGKNSDREPNEAQALLRVPRALHDLQHMPTVRATYIAVPQVRETYEVLLCKPFQMWGAEMGANEFGLAIGNEALFTRVPQPHTDDGLTGMDLIRLALERCRDAEAALELITDLIARYSQDACGGYMDRGFYYHNSFILADPHRAFVLETAGNHWAAVKVRGYRAISNGITIEGDYDFSSPGLIDFARSQGWLKAGADFSFRECYSDRFMTYFSRCRYRQARSTELGQARRGRLDVAGAFEILRDHGEQGPAFAATERFAGRRATMKALCVHASGMTAPSQTTGSMVAELRAGQDQIASTIWLTGTAAPCLGTFKPCFVTGATDGNLRASDFPQPGARQDERSLWWRHEQIHRAALRNYAAVAHLGLAARDELEREFLASEKEMLAGPVDSAALDRFSRECFAKADRLLEQWRARVASLRPAELRGPFAPLYRRYRRKLDRAAGY